MRDILIPSLFQGATTQIPGIAITSLRVKQSGIAHHNPTMITGENCTASCMLTGHLVTSLRGTAKFNSGDHTLLMGEERKEIHQQHAEEADTALRESRAAALNPVARWLGRIQRTGVWL